MRKLSSILALVICLAAANTAHGLPTSEGFVESTTLPIRVYYNTFENQNLAEDILGFAEEAWVRQLGMGFAAPYTVDDNLDPIPGIRFYLFASSGNLAQAVPITGITDTTAADCATVIKISDDSPSEEYPSLVAYGLNHGMQLSTDCLESPFSYEHITMAVSMVEYPLQWAFPFVLKDFQSTPHRSIDSMAGNDYYNFGSSFFPLFLDWYYGSGGGDLLARFWSATPQDGEVEVINGWTSSATENEPDLLDAFRTVLAEEGIDFNEAFAIFSRYRYFTGTLDDGNHYPRAGSWSGTEVHMDQHYSMDQLHGLTGNPIQPPQELGVSYIAFDTEGAAPSSIFRLAFEGQQTQWQVTVLSITDDGSSEHILQLDDQQRAEIALPLADNQQRFVLVATNLGDNNHDPDQINMAVADFTYKTELLHCPRVELTDADPGELESGTTAKFRLKGEGFPADQSIAVQISGKGTSVRKAVRLQSQELDVTVEVDADAKAGPRDISVSFECGSNGSASDLLTIHRPGCGCSGTSRGHAGLLILVGLPLVLWRRS